MIPCLKIISYASPNKFFEAMELGQAAAHDRNSLACLNWLTKYGFGAVCGHF